MRYACSLFLLTLPAFAATNLVQNPTFEGSAIDGLAAHWSALTMGTPAPEHSTTPHSPPRTPHHPPRTPPPIPPPRRDHIPTVPRSVARPNPIMRPPPTAPSARPTQTGDADTTAESAPPHPNNGKLDE